MPPPDCPERKEWNADLHPVASPGSSMFQIGLKRMRGQDVRRGPVLLVHGASASSRTFEIGGPPGRSPAGDGLATFLRDRGWDVWLLDWRASGILSALLLDDETRVLEPERFNLDDAREDLLHAVQHVKDVTSWSGRIPVVGHCIGGALVAETIATATDDPRSRHIGSIVLHTVALFFRSGFDDWVKGNERFLEEIWWQATTTGTSFISPWAACPELARTHAWPDEFERAYTLWCQTPLAHQCGNDFCHRACFMFGVPYRSADMMAIHDAPFPGQVRASSPKAGLWQQFGRMPLVTYMHCVQNLRRGWAAGWLADDSDTRYLVPGPFGERAVTLITGNENQVWHRDSIDRMYEWLRRELPVAHRPHMRKHVLSNYGHQDLLWSSKSADDVYPKIEAGLA